MRFLVATVGRPRDAAIAAAVADYEHRAARYWPLEALHVRQEPARGNTADLVRDREGARLLARLTGARIIVCDRSGDQMTSEEFAGWLQDIRESGRDAAFAIGGAFGLPESVVAGAWRRLSVAPWTLPHEVAHLVLAEQLYRAGTILRGEPYHK